MQSLLIRLMRKITLLASINLYINKPRSNIFGAQIDNLHILNTQNLRIRLNGNNFASINQNTMCCQYLLPSMNFAVYYKLISYYQGIFVPGFMIHLFIIISTKLLDENEMVKNIIEPIYIFIYLKYLLLKLFLLFNFTNI